MSTHVMSTHVVYKHVPGSVPVNWGNWPPPEEVCSRKKHVPKTLVFWWKLVHAKQVRLCLYYDAGEVSCWYSSRPLAVRR